MKSACFINFDFRVEWISLFVANACDLVLFLIFSGGEIVIFNHYNAKFWLYPKKKNTVRLKILFRLFDRNFRLSKNCHCFLCSLLKCSYLIESCLKALKKNNLWHYIIRSLRSNNFFRVSKIAFARGMNNKMISITLELSVLPLKCNPVVSFNMCQARIWKPRKNCPKEKQNSTS